MMGGVKKDQFEKQGKGDGESNPMMAMMKQMQKMGGNMDGNAMAMNPMMAMMMQQNMMMAQMMGMKGKGKGKGWQSDWKYTMSQINKIDPEKKVFVSNLPEEVKWKELLTHFADAGHKPGLAETMSKGTGVCCFKEAAQAAAAIEALNNSNLSGNVINVDHWQ